MNPQESDLSVSNLSINLRQAICALAEALGLVGIDEKQHGERVAYMGVKTAEILGWDDTQVSNLFHSGLLHDCGVSSTRMHNKLVTELDWAGSEGHCIVGEQLLLEFRPLAHLAPVIRYHHTHWDALDKLGVAPEVAVPANLIYLVDRVDAVLAQHVMNGEKLPFEDVRNTIEKLSGSFFSPELVEAFLEASSNEAFWLNLEPLNIVEYIHAMGRLGTATITEFDDLRTLSCIFAKIVDAKSKFTFEHSMGVARLVVYISKLMGLPPERIALMEISALLHDLGKLGVPDEVLDKPSKLNREETAIMHRHSYDTYQILRQISGFEEIADWAGNHHETLLGDGYPFHHQGKSLPIETRTIMVADIFQALAQDRPYRASLPPERIMGILNDMVDAGRVDKDIVAVVEGHKDTCWQIATAPTLEPQ